MKPGFPEVRPASVGLSAERLKRIDSAFQSEVDRGKMPGAVVLIAPKGKIAYFEAFGLQDREKQLRMRADAIFRIASLTKPIVSAAFMTLVEEGKARLTAPVSLYLPEFKEIEVGREKSCGRTGKSELTMEP